MTAIGSSVNAALLAAVILLAALGQTARQGRSADEYYDEEIYYDEKAADGSADFSEDLTYAQYDQVTVKTSPTSSSSPQLETKTPKKAAMKLPAKVPAKISAKVPPKVPEKTTLFNAPTVVPANVPAKVPANVPAKVPVQIPTKVPVDVSVNTSATISSTSSLSGDKTKSSTRGVHAAMQKLLATYSTTTSPADSSWSEKTPATDYFLDTCHVLHSEASLQVSLRRECVKVKHARIQDRQQGWQLFLRKFNLSSRTTQFLWRRLLSLMPEEDRKNYQGCNMTYVNRTAKLCDRNLENAKEAAQIMYDYAYSHSPSQGWKMVCRLVKEYRFCMSELLAGCHSIGAEINRRMMVNVRAEGLPFCVSGGVRCVAAAPLAVALAHVALFARAAQRP